MNFYLCFGLLFALVATIAGAEKKPVINYTNHCKSKADDSGDEFCKAFETCCTTKCQADSKDKTHTHSATKCSIENGKPKGLMCDCNNSQRITGFGVVVTLVSALAIRNFY